MNDALYENASAAPLAVKSPAHERVRDDRRLRALGFAPAYDLAASVRDAAADIRRRA